jgi:molybdate transport system substrate-binding protein
MKRSLLVPFACLFAEPASVQAEGLVLYHAGSLTAAMKDIAASFTADTGLTVRLVAGGSGSLRQRIEKGERPDLFASADLDNPSVLAKEGLAEGPVAFTQGALCVLAMKNLGLSQANLIGKLLDLATKVGTSTPVLDPSGDYAWKFFDLAGTAKAGAAEALKAKAIKLMGNPALPLPPKDYTKSRLAWLFETGQADALLLYKSSAGPVMNELPGLLEVITLPPNLAVSALYGMTTVKGAKPEAAKLSAFILGPKGQEILQKWGFLPRP